MQSGLLSSGFCLLAHAVCNQSDSHAPLQNFLGGGTKTGFEAAVSICLQ